MRDFCHCETYLFAMGMKKELTVAQRGTIFYCQQRGDSYRKIADTVGCSLSTVAFTIKRHKETNSFKSRKRSGRPLLMDSFERRLLKRLVTRRNAQNRRLCTGGVQTLWRETTKRRISIRTIGRVLRSMGLRNCLARRKPLISKANKAARLEWCLDHADWTTRDWAKVLWSDESTFTQFQQNRCSRVWQEPMDKWSPSCLVATVKHSPSRMCWGCFSRQGVGPLVPLEGSVTGVSHVETLRKHALPTFKRMFPRGEGWFQEDNARPHTAKVAVTFREKRGLRTLPWPAQSPDLNPIENLWAVVKRNLQKRKRQPSSLSALDRYVKQEWRAIPKDLIENLVDSMPNRIQAVIAAKGGPTKY